MCRYAKQGEPKPRRCFFIEDPCDQCEKEEQEKIDYLYDKHVEETAKDEPPTMIRINDHLLAESF